MLLQRVVFYFFAVIVLFLWFDKSGLLLLKLSGPAAVYAAAALFASICTMVLFLISILVYNPGLRGRARFLADLLSVLIASVVPVMVLALAGAFLPAQLALAVPVFASLFRIWSTVMPVIWIGWLALMLLFGDLLESQRKVVRRPPVDTTPVDALNSTGGDVRIPLNLPVPESATSGKTPVSVLALADRPRWLVIYEVALLRLENGELELAKTLLLECLGLLEREGDKSSQHRPLDLLLVTQKYAQCLLQLGEYQLARTSFERALRLLNRLPDRSFDGEATLFAELMDGLDQAYRNGGKDQF
ncbi:MAG: hypothetical protein SFV17_08255 [Candidatus Obscuribacter sp.]|nr:hypothetical protein [Candidatus Obscuribacter sp.]